MYRRSNCCSQLCYNVESFFVMGAIVEVANVIVAGATVFVVVEATVDLVLGATVVVAAGRLVANGTIVRV